MSDERRMKLWEMDWRKQEELMNWKNMPPELLEDVKITTVIKVWQNLTLDKLSNKRGDKAIMIQVALNGFFDQLERNRQLTDLLENKIPEIIEKKLEEALDQTIGSSKLDELSKSVTNAINLVKNEALGIQVQTDLFMEKLRKKLIYLVALDQPLPNHALVKTVLAELVELGYLDFLNAQEYVLSHRAMDNMDLEV